jgi:hypothetical protein
MTDARAEYLADALCQFCQKYPGVQLDRDGFYEVPAAVLDALKQYEAGKAYEVPKNLWEGVYARWVTQAMTPR